MAHLNYAGYWTGSIVGTNQGGFTFELTQDGDQVSGKACISEPSIGQYEYLAKGTGGETLSLTLTPGRQTGGIGLGIVHVVGSMEENNTLTGRWKSNILTEGIFTAKRFDQKSLKDQLPEMNSVFLVHGHDEGAKHGVARFLEQLGVSPVILQEQINKGLTVIEKFEEFSSRAGFAVVLMTPDDFGYPHGKEEDIKPRPRQNVILELGYFLAKLGRNKTIVLTKGDIELPSDVFGVVYEAMDRNEGWKLRVAKELKAAGFAIDLNKVI